jgi:PAT family beta-lactamase induction signal transducer AmpG
MVLLFVLLFRLPDSAAGTVTGLFLRDVGFTKTDIALYRQFLGGVVTIVAALWGGVLVARMGTRKSLWLFGGLQALSNLGFWVLAMMPGKLAVMISVMVVENLCGGLVTAGFFVFLMNQCRPEFSATQYALLSGVMAVAGIAVGSVTGTLVQQMGYPGFFLLTVGLGLPGLLILPALRLAPSQKRDNQPPGFPGVPPVDNIKP